MKSGFGFLNWNPPWGRISWTDFSEVKSVFGFRVRLGNPDLDFQNLNPDFPIEREIPKRISPDLDFVIEIHPEDGFLGGEIRFRISRSIAKSEIRISQSNATLVFNTRSSPSNKLYIKKSRLDIQKRAFSRVGAKIWNDIPAPKKTLQNETPVFPCWYLWNMMTILIFPKLPLVWK